MYLYKYVTSLNPRHSHKMVFSLRLVLTLLTLIAINLISAEIRPDPIPRVYTDENLLDNTLYGLAYGPNNQIRERITALENYISELVNKGEVLINKYLDSVEAKVIQTAAANGIANVEKTIAYVDAQVSTFENDVFDLVDLLINRVRSSVKKLKNQIETETQASLASGTVRSTISRIERLIERTIASLQALLNRTKLWIEAIIRAAEDKARGANSEAEGAAILRKAILAVDNSILTAENLSNRRIWDAYNRVHSETKPLTSFLHSLL